MNPHVLNTLAHLLGRFGPDLMDDIRRIESYLRDIHPDAPREVAVLVEALACGVVTRLRLFLAQSGVQTLPAPDRDELVRHLTDNSGISGRFALWAVDGWLEVLGVESTSVQPVISPGTQRGSIVRDRPGTLDSVLGRHLHPKPIQQPSSNKA